MIYFVGAGSGAADLITVRGARLLERADLVVWAGSLVNRELLSYCRKDCEIYDSASMTLEETDALLQAAARAEKLCVRLHTGDPAIFGAIREQMELLDKAGIPYEIVPGVSSMFAAAAAVKQELTVPGVSQTVIISRMEGKTPVPPRERIAALASHGATMVLFLSSGMIPALCRELLAGAAYTADTPCAVVYKASWQDEKIVQGTLENIAEKAAAAGITKTALVLVGDFLGSRYSTSRLYDKAFSTGFRSASAPAAAAPLPAAQAALPFDRISAVCFSACGEALAGRILDACGAFAADRTFFRCYGERHGPLADWCRDQFALSREGKRTLLVFVGASGIAVRALAPLVEHKAADPAVVCMDEAGRFAIPLLSGHLGGANEAARFLAAALGAIPALTTATDVRGLWALDSWACQHGWHIPDLSAVKRISAAVLAGKKVLSLGLGCRRGISGEILLSFVQQVFSEQGLPLSLVADISSISLKKDEPGIAFVAAALSLPLRFYSQQELNGAKAGKGGFSQSDFVQQTTGTGCVCERAAVLSAQSSADWLLLRKTVGEGCTLALACCT